MNLMTSLPVLLLILTGLGCSSNKLHPAPDMHTSQSSLDWEGTYEGMLPCADCPGISTFIQLYQNNTFHIHQKYEDSEGAEYTSSGTFTWTDGGRNVVFKDSGATREFQVGENKLFWLDGDGKRISGPLEKKFMLTKVENTITEKYWKLTELMGEAVRVEGTREAYIVLKQEGNVFNGNGGCNVIGGSYSLSERKGISFSNIVATKMACEALATEQKLIKALQDAGRYLLKGDTLFLHNGRMAPLAKFEAVYLR